MTTPARRLWSLALGPLMDAATFLVLVHGGWHYGLAHLVSFTLGAACSALALPTARPASVDSLPAPTLAPWLSAHLLALPLRGGLLALWIGRWGAPPSLAIAGAIVVSSMVVLCGRNWPARVTTSPDQGSNPW